MVTFSTFWNVNIAGFGNKDHKYIVAKSLLGSGMEIVILVI